MNGDVLKDEKLIKEFMKHEAKELEKEIDSAAFMAESMVSAAESTLKSFGMSDNSLNVFEDIIETIEEVREHEDEYLENL